MCRAGRHFREADRLERALDGRQQVTAGRRRVGGPQRHLLGSAAGGNQTHAGLDEADVGFGGRLDAIGVQGDLASATERQPGRRDDDRHAGVTKAERRLLERADHQVEVVPVLFLRLEEDQHQVGAGREVVRLVADDQRREVL